MTKQLLVAACMAALTVAPAQAQNYYDLTDVYLQNAGFDSDFDYPASASGNVAQEILEVKGWTKNISVNYTITGVYELGTAKTFNGAAIPSRGYDGTSTGGVLALSTGWMQSMLFNQTVKLPAGRYGLVTAYYNCGDKTVGTSKCGWLPSGGTAVLSTLKSYAIGEWKTDTVWFELDKTTAGKIQVGYQSGNSGSANSAKIAIDFVKLLRDTPEGSADVEPFKETLAADIAAAGKTYGDGSGTNAALLMEAITKAQGVMDNSAATRQDVENAVSELATAVDAYLWENPTGAKPTVTTDRRYARGATMAFGRMTATGTGIMEQGFCWSQTPEPTIKDSRTTEFLNNNGRIYCLRDLKPASLYYMRAYAITTGRQVAYGDVIKFYTIPKGNVRYEIRSGGDAAAVARITEAVKNAVDYWNNLTSIPDFTTSVGYNSGVPTAECSYGGWMSVGSNSSYQATGTIMHEMLHGVGVIPWADTEWSRHNMRSGVNGDGKGTGYWLGDRVTEVLRFWDNSTTERLNGDYQHMWPYGINGAHEDNGTEVLYIGNGLVCQALGEDGLQHTSGSYARPYYSFDCEDGVKYYIKNESAECGLYTSFLVPNRTGQLVWKSMSEEQVAQNDSAAWYITFTPDNQYYQLRNAATGRYMTYSGSGLNGFKTITRSTPTAAEDFHLMRGRNDISAGSATIAQRGYWMIHPQNNWTPRCVQANANGTVSALTFSIASGATTQRWLIMTAGELKTMQQESLTGMKEEIQKALETLKTLVAVPHTEDEPGIDEATEALVQRVESTVQGASSSAELATLQDEIKAAVKAFLAAATPSDVTKPFDLTYMLSNPGMNSTDGWTGTPTLNYSCGEFYQTTFDFYQTLTGLPAGTYQLCAKGFQRPGNSTTVWSNYIAGKDNVTAYIYAGASQQKMADICTEAQGAKIGGAESSVGSPVKYIPNDMQSASLYFAKGMYENGVLHTLAADGNLRVGVRSNTMSSYYWVIFDDFRLYYYGSMDKDFVGVKSVQDAGGVSAAPKDAAVYTIGGTKVADGTQSLRSLGSGVYIINGRKYVK